MANSGGSSGAFVLSVVLSILSLAAAAVIGLYAVSTIGEADAESPPSFGYASCTENNTYNQNCLHAYEATAESAIALYDQKFQITTEQVRTATSAAIVCALAGVAFAVIGVGLKVRGEPGTLPGPHFAAGPPLPPIPGRGAP